MCNVNSFVSLNSLNFQKYYMTGQPGFTKKHMNSASLSMLFCVLSQHIFGFSCVMPFLLTYILQRCRVTICTIVIEKKMSGSLMKEAQWMIGNFILLHYRI